MKHSGIIRLSNDSPKTLVKLDPSKFYGNSYLGFVGSNLKWMSAYKMEGNTPYLIKLKDLIIQGVSFSEIFLENPCAYVGDEPAILIPKNKFIHMMN